MLNKEGMYILQNWLKSIQKRRHLLIQLLVWRAKLFQERFSAWTQLHRAVISTSLILNAIGGSGLVIGLMMQPVALPKASYLSLTNYRPEASFKQQHLAKNPAHLQGNSECCRCDPAMILVQGIRVCLTSSSC